MNRPSSLVLQALLAALLVLNACGDAENRYAGYQKLAVGDDKAGVYLHKRLLNGEIGDRPLFLYS